MRPLRPRVHGPLVRPPSGFTIVELLVVIGILTLLTGLVLAGLSGARKRMRKTEELSALRQVGMAWTMYANHNKEHVLPGFLDVAVQKAWRVTYRDSGGEPLLPAPDFEAGLDSDHNVAGPWPWRLMTYLDHAESVVAGHLDADELAAMAPDERAREIRSNPAFGYNGLFVGGWYASPRRVWFENATDAETEARVQVVSRSIGSIRRSSELVIFGSSALRTPGLYRYQRGRDDFAGSYMIQPPILGTNELWGLPRTLAVDEEGADGNLMTARTGGDIFSIEYYGDGNWEDGPLPGG